MTLRGGRIFWESSGVALIGTVVLLVALIGLIQQFDAAWSQILFVIGVGLLFLAMIIAVQSQAVLTRIPIYIGTGLTLFVLVVLGVALRTQNTDASPQAHCALLVRATPTLALEHSVLDPINGEVVTPTPKPEVTRARKHLSALEVGVKAPTNLDASGSDFVGIVLNHRLTLAPRRAYLPTIVPVEMVGGKQCDVSTQKTNPATGGGKRVVPSPIPVGTQGVPVERAFGSGYDVYATAKLAAVKFDTTPNNIEWQSLDQQIDEWGWTITPKAVGRQVIFFNVDLQWRPRPMPKGTPAPVQHERLVWQSDPLYIDVREDRFAWGQMQGMPLVSTTIGAAAISFLGGLVNWIWKGREKDAPQHEPIQES